MPQKGKDETMAMANIISVFLTFFVGAFALTGVFAALGAVTVRFGRRHDADTADEVFDTAYAMGKCAAVSALAAAACLCLGGLPKDTSWLLAFGGAGLAGAVLYGVFAFCLHRWYLRKEQRCVLSGCGTVSLVNCGEYDKRHSVDRYTVTLAGWTCGGTLLMFSTPHFVRKGKELFHEGQMVSLKYNEDGEIILSGEHPERLAVIGMAAAVVAAAWCSLILCGIML